MAMQLFLDRIYLFEHHKMRTLLNWSISHLRKS